MYKNIKILSAITLFAIGSAKAQEGFGTNNPDASSVLDMIATDKGFLAPRLALTGTADVTTVVNAAHALTVFNTATAGSGATAVTPGYYYWNKDAVTPANSRWIALATPEPWNVRSSVNKATGNTENIYQQGNVAIGTQNGLGVFNIDATKDNPITGTPTATNVLDDIIVTPGGRVGFGYSPSDAVILGRQVDDKITFQANDDLDVNYSMATTNNAQAIVHRNIISSGTMAARTARPNGTSIAAFEGHTSTSNSTYGGGSLITQQRAGIVLRTGKENAVGGEIWFGTSGASGGDGGKTLVTTAGNSYRAILDQRGRWALGADPNLDAFYRNPSERLDLILGGIRVGALGYGTLAAWQTVQAAERPNYISTDPNDKVVVADANGVLKVKDASTLSNDWRVTGNAGTTPATNFLGTTDAQDVVLRTNNLERVRVTQTGRLDFSNTSGSATNIFVEGGNETTTGIWNTAVGRSALNAVTSGNQNTALGASALQATTTGADNTAIGQRALSNVTSGFSNTAVGLMAGNAVTTANSNVLVGSQAGLVLTTGVSNVFVGTGAGGSTASGRNNIAIGQGVSLPTTNGDYQLNIGNTIFGTGLTGSVLAPVGKSGQYSSTKFYLAGCRFIVIANSLHS